MLNNISPTWPLGGWFVAVALVVASSITMDAKLSTSVLLFLMGIAPVVVMLLIGASASPPTVAEVLHSVNAKGRR